MTPGFVLPAVVALVAAGVLGAAVHRISPATATRMLTAATLTGMAGILAATAAVAVAYLAQLPRIARAVGWCQAVISHHDRVPPELGVPALILLVAMGFAAVRAVRRRRRTTALHQSENAVEILPSDQPVAYAVPGRPGHVVVSVGMIRCLDADERRVLFAHERAHLAHHHHRFLAVAEIATAAVPLLRPLLTRLRHATERWADEIAAAELGDRQLVARTIARAALAGHAPGLAMALTGTGVVARVEALLDERRPTHWVGTLVAVALVSVLVTSATGSGVQLHHLVTMIEQICR